MLQLRCAPLCLFLALSCAAADREAGGGDHEPSAGVVPATLPKHDYVLVFLLSGSQEAGLDAGDRGQIMAGHFANMARLGEEGVLLVAGPLPEPRSRPGERGLFVFDVAEPRDALALAASDPAIDAGVLVPEALPLRSATPLARLPQLLRAARERGELGSSPTDGVRAFVLATSPTVGERELDRLSAASGVLVSGLFERPEGRAALVVLDAATPAEGLQALAAAGSDPARWSAHPFWSTRLLSSL